MPPRTAGFGNRDRFEFDNIVGQVIMSFSNEDAPGDDRYCFFDLSGSMSSKFMRARKALSEFVDIKSTGRVFCGGVQR